MLAGPQLVERVQGYLPNADLKVVQQDMISKGEKRTQINRHARIIKRMFKWAASEELIPASTFEALRSVDGLKFGRTDAKESEPVRPVSEVDMQAALPLVSIPIQNSRCKLRCKACQHVWRETH